MFQLFFVNAFLLSINTLITKVSISYFTEFHMFKDGADRGYIINENEYQFARGSIRKEDDYDNHPVLSLFQPIIPFYNIYKELENTYYYFDNREEIIEDLIKVHAFEKMTEIEKYEYSKRRSGVFAYFLTEWIEAHLEDAKIETIKSSNFYYKTDDDGDITLFKVEGEAAKLPLKKQYHLLKRALGLNDNFDEDDIAEDKQEENQEEKQEEVKETPKKEELTPEQRREIIDNLVKEIKKDLNPKQDDKPFQKSKK